MATKSKQHPARKHRLGAGSVSAAGNVEADIKAFRDTGAFTNFGYLTVDSHTSDQVFIPVFGSSKGTGATMKVLGVNSVVLRATEEEGRPAIKNDDAVNLKFDQHVNKPVVLVTPMHFIASMIYKQQRIAALLEQIHRKYVAEPDVEYEALITPAMKTASLLTFKLEAEFGFEAVGTDVNINVTYAISYNDNYEFRVIVNSDISMVDNTDKKKKVVVKANPALTIDYNTYIHNGLCRAHEAFTIVDDIYAALIKLNDKLESFSREVDEALKGLSPRVAAALKASK